MLTNNFFYLRCGKDLKIGTMESLEYQIKIDQEEVGAQNYEI